MLKRCEHIHNEILTKSLINKQTKLSWSKPFFTSRNRALSPIRSWLLVFSTISWTENIRPQKILDSKDGCGRFETKLTS